MLCTSLHCPGRRHRARTRAKSVRSSRVRKDHLLSLESWKVYTGFSLICVLFLRSGRSGTSLCPSLSLSLLFCRCACCCFCRFVWFVNRLHVSSYRILRAPGTWVQRELSSSSRCVYLFTYLFIIFGFLSLCWCRSRSRELFRLNSHKD